MRKPFYVLVYLALGTVGCTPAQYNNAGDGGGRDGKGADATPPHTCSPETPSQSKGMAESCSCDRECRTGFCVDGVCCTTACGQTCMACNLPSSLGVCATVPAGVTPNDPSVCAASTPASCGQDGTCDGKGACRLYVQGIHCKTGTCDGDSVTGILTCDGKGNCSDAQPISQPCPPYTCDPTTHQCASTCSTDAQCSKGHQCVAGSCGKSPNGAPCTTNDGCSSGFCVDGVCCNVACAGACVSCKLTESAAGNCEPIPAGVKDSACIATAPTTCGRSGVCDGFGSCALFPENTVCGPSSCAGLQENTPRTCDGHGTCRESGLLDCAPFLCTNNACTQTCATDQDCEDGHQCVLKTVNGVTTGTCGLMAIGQPCVDASRCQSGQCVDGVCCENGCTGACRSCNSPSSPGRCLNAAIGAADPRSTCKDLGAAACSTNGFCDGNGACQNYPAGTVCGPESCVAGAYDPPSVCNASSQCVASRSRTCSPFLCNGSTCFDICTSDTQCVAGSFCTNSSCGLKPPGAKCGAATECQSGFCAQGVCCENACIAACMACNLTTTSGLCVAVADNAPDPQGKCSVTQANTCGTTGTCVKGACAYYAKDLNCKAAVCASASVATPASTCDGAGTCAPPDNIKCDPFICASGACENTCTADKDCVAPATCVLANAVPTCGLKGHGLACTAASQCQSGFCTEGLCCNSACADAASGGLCKTCKGTTTSQAGTCSNVDSGGSDPKSRCVKSNAGSGDCSNDGTCNGAGACRAWSSSTGCRQQSCTGSTLTSSANCDGKGACPAAISSSCGSYVCNSSSPTCLNTCTGNSSCTGGITCNTITNKCGDKLTGGDQCTVGTDCTSGYCVGGVCCTAACTDGCMECRLSGNGTCLKIAAGGPPRIAGTCAPVAASGVCGNTGLCDGNDACQQETTCLPTITACPTEKGYQYKTAIDSGSCSAGTCTPNVLQACSTGYLCVSGTGKCATDCGTTDANCDTANGYYCFGGTCRQPAAGEACTSPTRKCPSGLYCVDGVCCNNACATTCWSCNVAGSVGTCTKVPKNISDDACPGSCSTDRTQASGLCDGNGACQPLTSCLAGYGCSSGICETVCSGNGDCAANYQCVGGTCKKVNGQTCTTGTGCASGNCVPSVSGGSSICCASVCPPSGVQTCGNNNQCQIDGSACVGSVGEACPGADQCHQPGTCKADGTCNIPIKPDGTSCSDGNLCTNGDSCLAGTCVSGPALNCDDGNVCTTDGCNTTTGCTHVNNAILCNDGNACTVGDVCSGGACVPGTAALNCDDGNVCTDDTCNQASGCVHTNNTSACDDGNACTTGDRCSAGKCVGGSAPNCDDGNACTDDTCNQASGCVHTNNTSACDDGNACTTGDRCSAGKCVGGSAPNCDDGNVCTDDTCNQASGCVHTNNTSACDDGNACTTNDTCAGGKCVGTRKSCDDSNPCTDDSCNSSGDCVHANNTNPCDDGNACTTNDTCAGGRCVGTGKSCDDSNPCTDDSCNSSGDCVHANNTNPCDDGNACTTNDTCAGGKCVGTGKSCDDSNPCTDDSCNSSGDCVHANNTNPCDDGNACTAPDQCSGGNCVGAPIQCDPNSPSCPGTCACTNGTCQ